MEVRNPQQDEDRSRSAGPAHARLGAWAPLPGSQPVLPPGFAAYLPHGTHRVCSLKNPCLGGLPQWHDSPLKPHLMRLH